MTSFTFRPQVNDYDPATVDLDCFDQDDAIEKAKGMLRAVIDHQPMGHVAEHGTVEVGEGSRTAGRDVSWIGAWEWSEARGWRWKPRR